MSKNSDSRPPSGRASTLTTETEGYLLAHAHHQDACREAADLCARMPWLTTAQIEIVTQHYIHQRLETSRQMLMHICERASTLRHEYEQRYSTLRRMLLRRHAVCACVSLACLGGTSTLACLLDR